MKTYRALPVVIQAIQWYPGVTHPAIRCTSTVVPLAYIDTLEGTMQVGAGDWIIKGTMGEHYPCKDEVFKRKYEPAPEAEGTV